MSALADAFVIATPNGSVDRFLGTAEDAVRHAGRFIYIDHRRFREHVKALEEGRDVMIVYGFSSCSIEPE